MAGTSRSQTSRVRQAEGKRRIEQAPLLSASRHSVGNLGFAWSDLAVAPGDGGTHVLRLSRGALGAHATVLPEELLPVARRAHSPLASVAEAALEARLEGASLRCWRARRYCRGRSGGLACRLAVRRRCPPI